MSPAYKNACFIITTKHAKSVAIAPAFSEHLGAVVIEYALDTDMLGTFSGEIEREGSALDCAKKKCEWSLEKLGTKVNYALASEGSFGPHPYIPFLPCDNEILYFIDRERDFHLYLSYISEKTNYQMKELDSFEELQKFAEDALFPSHTLIIRPNMCNDKRILFKGMDTQEALKNAFHESIKHSSDNKIWVETDMRANMNPSRMSVIGELAENLAQRLATECPKCKIPGWGKVSVEKGLECSWCGSETELVKTEIFGCVKCDYKETKQRNDGLTRAEPANCGYCNP